METAKQCRAQSAECLSLAQSARNETEARLLSSLSQSWVRLANQIDRYRSLLSSCERTIRSADRLHAPLHNPFGAGESARREA